LWSISAPAPSLAPPPPLRSRPVASSPSSTSMRGWLSLMP
jgi:hypothetical protein